MDLRERLCATKKGFKFKNLESETPETFSPSQNYGGHCPP